MCCKIFFKKDSITNKKYVRKKLEKIPKLL